ncbi:MAG: DoxX family protein [Verrucomicrobiota bacterium JB023]|nr:DoxX family protein [Verrucomicrobiota bacterium JB023]
MRKSKTKITGWGLSGVLVAFLIFSASGKFTDWEGQEEMFTKMGWDINVMMTIGMVEVLIGILFLIPRLSVIGAILVTAYLGGATATHVRIGDAFYFPIVLGALVWTALALRNPLGLSRYHGTHPEISQTRTLE